MTDNHLTNEQSIEKAKLFAWGRYIEQFHGLKPCPIEKEHEALMVVLQAYEEKRCEYTAENPSPAPKLPKGAYQEKKLEDPIIIVGDV